MAALNCTALTGDSLILCEQTQKVLEEQLAFVVASDYFLQADVNSFFLIWASSLVLWMHAGFAMLSAGALRTKNTKNILISIVMDLTVCAVAWYLCGFAFAYGTDQGGFIGSSYWVGIDVGSTLTGTTSFYFWLFQYCFAATAATIVSGAIAERARFETYLFYSFFMSFWVYPVVVHWVWGGGFLTLGNPNGKSLLASGVVDFAGCGPVHMVGGLAGLIGSKIMGPRIGRFDPETGKALPIPGHSAPLATLGVFILWIGWLGFNPGSVLIIAGGSGAIAARAAVMTVLSSATGALSAMIYAHFTSAARDYDLGMALNGALAGLVSITGCCAFVEMWAAVAIGLIGGVIYVSSSRFLLNTLKIDDPLDATPVHFFCGMYGIIAGAFFANPAVLDGFFAAPIGGCVQVPSGVFYGGNTYITKCRDADGALTTKVGGTILGALVANAVVEIVCIIVWVTVFMTPLFLGLHKMGVLRVATDIESVGLDVSHHGGEAYPELFHSYEFTDSKKSGRRNGEASADATPTDIEKQEVPLAPAPEAPKAEAVSTT